MAILYGFQIFPGDELIGMGWPDRKQGSSTLLDESTSGQEVRIQNWLQERYRWQIPFGYLNDNYLLAAADFQIIMGFHELQGGRANAFLIDIANDNDTSQNVPNPVANPTPSPILNANPASSNYLSPFGDGTTKIFQLARAWNGSPHLVYYVNSANRAPRVYVNNVEQFGFNYTISNTGLVTFNLAPSNGSVVTADFQYYFLVRFFEDNIAETAVAGSYHMIDTLEVYETFQ